MFSKEWWVDNLTAEIIFGVIVIGAIGFVYRVMMDAFRAFRVYRIISIHNEPSRTRKKGFHARDRFLDIFESNTALNSNIRAYNTGFIDSAFNEQYIDRGILEHHGLVTVRETSKGITTEANRNRVSKWVYALAKLHERREQRITEAFVLDKSGKRRKLPN